ncbi:MAG TPA: response regulator transcription factor [Solirubrobacteraceae bacterium]
MSVRVFIADDVADVRELLRAQLAGDPDLDVVGEAANGRAALEGILHTEPDVALVDLSMPALDGVEVVRGLRDAGLDARVLVISAGTPAQEARAREAGAHGYLSKPVPAAKLRAAVHQAAAAARTETSTAA